MIPSSTASKIYIDLSLTSAWPLEHDPSPNRGQAVNRRGVNWVVSGRSVSQPTSASVFPSPVRQGGTEWQQKKVMTCYLYDLKCNFICNCDNKTIMQRCGGWVFFNYLKFARKNPPAIHQSPNSAQNVDSWALPLVALVQLDRISFGESGDLFASEIHGCLKKKNCVIVEYIYIYINIHICLFEIYIYIYIHLQNPSKKKPGTKNFFQLFFNLNRRQRCRYKRQMSSADQLRFSCGWCGGWMNLRVSPHVVGKWPRKRKGFRFENPKKHGLTDVWNDKIEQERRSFWNHVCL